MHRFAGGMATALQAHGLPPYTPVEPWLRTHPQHIESVLNGFQRAGCTHALTPTFMAASTPESLPSTVHLAVKAVRDAGVLPWGSSGPVAAHPDTYAALAQALVDEGVTSLTLETFTDGDAALQALVAVRSIPQLTDVVVSVVPTDDGTHLLGGGNLPTFAHRAVAAGATGVGVNCVAPDVVARSAGLLAGIAPLWLFPSGASDWAAAVHPFAAQATWLGGCCGVDAACLNALWSSL